jgi:hypothetical protein
MRAAGDVIRDFIEGPAAPYRHLPFLMPCPIAGETNPRLVRVARGIDLAGRSNSSLCLVVHRTLGILRRSLLRSNLASRLVPGRREVCRDPLAKLGPPRSRLSRARSLSDTQEGRGISGICRHTINRHSGMRLLAQARNP